jgi:hypothetical protein
MSDIVEDRFIADIARDQVKHIAPQEAPIFPILSEANFQDPDKMLEAQGKDEMLGFGLELAAASLITPVVLTVTKEVVGFVAEVVMTSVQTQSSGLINDFVKKMFKKIRHEGEARGETLPPPLTREQIGRVREIALEKVRQLQLPPYRHCHRRSSASTRIFLGDLRRFIGNSSPIHRLPSFFVYKWSDWASKASKWRPLCGLKHAKEERKEPVYWTATTAA